jgi:hypothetical protein
MEGHERRGAPALDRNSQAGEGEAQETLPPVPLRSIVGYIARGNSTEGKEGPKPEDQGDHGRSAAVGSCLTDKDISWFIAPANTGATTTRRTPSSRGAFAAVRGRL